MTRRKLLAAMAYGAVAVGMPGLAQADIVRKRAVRMDCRIIGKELFGPRGIVIATMGDVDKCKAAPKPANQMLFEFVREHAPTEVSVRLERGISYPIAEVFCRSMAREGLQLTRYDWAHNALLFENRPPLHSERFEGNLPKYFYWPGEEEHDKWVECRPFDDQWQKDKSAFGGWENDPILEVECPICQAKAGQTCRRPSQTFRATSAGPLRYLVVIPAPSGPPSFQHL